jgi:hypothetical protein
MAKVTIIIEDGDGVDISAQFEPAINPGKEPTEAQRLAGAILAVLAGATGASETIFSLDGAHVASFDPKTEEMNVND